MKNKTNTELVSIIGKLQYDLSKSEQGYDTAIKELKSLHRKFDSLTDEVEMYRDSFDFDITKITIVQNTELSEIIDTFKKKHLL